MLYFLCNHFRLLNISFIFYSSSLKYLNLRNDSAFFRFRMRDNFARLGTTGTKVIVGGDSAGKDLKYFCQMLQLL
jgi:hypothetical protein